MRTVAERLRDLEKRHQAHTGRPKIIPNEGNSRFFGKDGDLLISDDPYFDPDKHPEYANKGYERAK